jgi:hypothetical protein
MKSCTKKKAFLLLAFQKKNKNERMMKIFYIKSVILITLIFASLVLAQGNNEHQVQSNISIESVINISITDLQNDNVWHIENMIYERPVISSNYLTIKLESNLQFVIFYFETSSADGNLSNGTHKIRTSYLLLPTASKNPHQMHPRWKTGRETKQLIATVRHGEENSWKLFAKLYADSSCRYGIYRDELNFIAMDGKGKKQVKKIIVQTELSEKNRIIKFRKFPKRK